LLRQARQNRYTDLHRLHILVGKVGYFRYICLTMATYKTVYKCRECGSTSYQRVIDRTQSGELQHTGQYRCTGCRNVFDSIRAWWEPRSQSEAQAPSLQAQTLSSVG
jgi:DNA-directed RNA polymerase subunit RPC12/RpoP